MLYFDKPLVIAITGLKNSGKNTVGGALAAQFSNYGYNVYVTCLAEPIKRYMRIRRKWNGSKEKGEREFMRMMFLNVCEISGYDTYLKLFSKRVEQSGAEIAIVTDVRRDCDAKWLRDNMHTQVIHIKRDGIISDGHSTEQPLAIANNDLVIHNDSDINSLYVNCQKITDMLVEK